ncbi:MAG TPA: zinc ribbon domain-containing protein [Deltaproteobacteria bacterium]|nr:zinc ribbon domain-containing protein [Deltaproteobacteria bacterium]
MPIYEYRCMNCNHEFEVMQKFSDSPVKDCPKCSGQVKKRVSATSFQLKGSGWYLTDYAKKGSGAAAHREESSNSVSETASETKSETKPSPAAKDTD